MAKERRTPQGPGSRAAIASALNAITQLKGKMSMVLPAELWNLLISLVENADVSAEALQDILEEISKISINVQGWPTNTPAIQTVRVICPVANTAVQLPDMPIPDGFSLVIAAWPLNANLIYIGEDQSAATNPNRIDAIAAGAARTLAIQNANVIWISALAANDSVTLVSEKRK